MAVLISAATGNWTAAATWKVVDATSYSNSEATVAYVPQVAGAGARSNTFVPGAITIDAIAVKLYAWIGGLSPDLTFTVNLYNSTDSVDVAGTSVTVNASDIPVAGGSGYDLQTGWVLFKFSAPVTLTAGKSYAVQAVHNTGNAFAFAIWVTAGNDWSRMLRTTTTKAPNSGSPDAPDDMVIIGELTGPGTSNSFTVTMDSTSATDYGTNTTSVVTPALAICNKGTLSFGTAAATNYYLKLSGWVVIYSGGTLNLGTTGTPIPRGSTAVLELDPTSDGTMVIDVRAGGTFNAQGLSRTSGKNVYYALMNANASAGATSLSVDTDTGWLDGDEIIVAGTESRTAYAGQCERGLLNGNAGASSLTVRGFSGSPDAGVVYAHGGVSPVQAEVALLTRNVKIRSSSASFGISLVFKPGSNIDFDWVEIYNLCGSAQLTIGVVIYYGTYYVDPDPIYHNVNIQFCSFHDGGATTLRFWQIDAVLGPAELVTNLVCSNNVFWATGVGVNVLHNQANHESLQISGNIFMGVYGQNVSGLYSIYMRGTFQNNRAAGLSTGFEFIGQDGPYNGSSPMIGTISGLVAHGCWTTGIYIHSASASGRVGSISNLTAYRNSVGVYFVNMTCSISTVLAFGNITNMADANGVNRWANFTLAGDTTLASNSNLQLDLCSSIFDDGAMSQASGIYVAAANDLFFNSAVNTRAVFRNCLTGAPVLASSYQGGGDSYASFEKFNRVAGDHRTIYSGLGQLNSGLPATVQTDFAIYNTTAPSVRMTPNNHATYSTFKLTTGGSGINRGMQVPVQSGGTVVISVYVRRSVAGDGAAYNGSLPRLILRANAAVGLSTDTVIMTAPGSPDLAGTWQQLYGTTPAATDDGVMEFVVDCDGTAGWVNVDDWAVA